MAEKVLSKPHARQVVSIAFPLGTLQASTVPTEGYEPRLISCDSVIQQLSGGEDTVSLHIENTQLLGKRTSDFWDFDNPPEGSNVKIYDWPTGETPALLFWGTVSEVENITETSVVINARSLDAKLDTVLGDPITLTDYPNCPDASVGLRKPRVYGSIERFKPILVDDNVVTKLKISALTSDTTIYVEDVGEFGNTGSLQINDEILSYTGRDTVDNKFTGCTRGTAGTTAQSHVSGDDVHEYGNLVFLVDEGALTETDAITNIKLINSDGVLLPAAESLYSVDKSGPTTITFNKVPLVPVAAAGSIFKDIDADNTATGNSALNPTYACGAHTDWTEYNFATINGGANTKLAIKRSGSDIDHPRSPIKRAYLVVEHWGVAELVGTGAKVNVYVNSVDKGDLTEETNTPDDIKEDSTIHTESKGFQDQHGHTIPGSNHGHEVEGEMVSPSWAEEAGGTWGYAFDNNPGTCFYLDASDSTRDTIKCKWVYGVPIADATLKAVQVRVLHGWRVPGVLTESLSCYVDLKIKNTSVFTNKIVSPDGTQKVLTKIDDSGSPFDVSAQNWTLEDLYDTNSWIHFDIIGSSGYFMIWETWIECWFVTKDHDIGDTQSITPLQTSKFTWFDVTSQITGADDAAKWQWFKDKKIEVEEENFHATDDKVYILRAFFVVEFINSRDEFTKEIACDVLGHSVCGNGAQILLDIAQNVLQLPSANIDLSAFTTAGGASSCGYGGALLEFETGRELFNRLGEQFRMSVFWEAGRLKPLFKTLISNLSDPSRTIGLDDILKGTFSVTRYPISEIYNRIRINYKADFIQGGTRKSGLAESTTSQSLYGKVGDYEVEADFIITNTHAGELGTQLLQYKAWGVDKIEATLTRDHIALKRGDLVSFSHRLGNWAKVEILEVEIQPQRKNQPTGVRIIGIERRTG